MQRTALRGALGLVLLAAVGVALTQRGRFDAAALQAWVEGAGAAGPLLFMGLYAVATVLFLPGAVITLAGGALFGPLWVTLRNLTGATVGAALPGRQDGRFAACSLSSPGAVKARSDARTGVRADLVDGPVEGLDHRRQRTR